MNKLKKTYWLIFSLGVLQVASTIAGAIYIASAFITYNALDSVYGITLFVMAIAIQHIVLSRYRSSSAFHQLYRDMKSGLNTLFGKAGL